MRRLIPLTPHRELVEHTDAQRREVERCLVKHLARSGDVRDFDPLKHNRLVIFHCCKKSSLESRGAIQMASDFLCV